MRDDDARRDSSGRIIVAIAFLEKDGSSSFFDCHVEDGFGDSRQFSEFWSEKKSPNFAREALTNIVSVSTAP